MTRTLPLAEAGAISEAARLLRAGGLVAFPTETVYGLGALATDETAVARIFEAKGRPRFNPLIVHLPDLARVAEIAEITPDARRLAAAFWPGPLTLVLPRKEGSGLSLLASAGLSTIAVRAPAHDGARALLEAVGAPVAAPSANASGRLSPSTAAHVAASLGDRVDLILDGGPCAVGLESAIVDVSADRPALLRPGGVAAEELERVLGRPLARPAATEDGFEGPADQAADQAAHGAADEAAPRAPGMLASHYAPGLPIRLEATRARPGEAYLAFGPDAPAEAFTLSRTGDLREAAANLFAALHQADDPERFEAIAVAPIPEIGLGAAINDRLRRAAAPRG